MYGHWEHRGMNAFGFTDGFGYEAFLHWVIVGAESGPKARPMDDNWVRSLRDQCQEAGVPFYFKQRVHAGHKEIAPFLNGRQWLQFPNE
jgi:protein gp37